MECGITGNPQDVRAPPSLLGKDCACQERSPRKNKQLTAVKNSITSGRVTHNATHGARRAKQGVDIQPVRGSRPPASHVGPSRSGDLRVTATAQRPRLAAGLTPVENRQDRTMPSEVRRIAVTHALQERDRTRRQ